MRQHAVVQLSGGYDSAAAALRATARCPKITAVFVDYGQPYVAKEREAAAWFARAHLHCTLWDLRVNLMLGHTIPNVPKDYIPARNFVLGAMLVNVAESLGADTIVVGNKGENAGGGEYQFPDAGSAFFRMLTDIARHISYNPQAAPQFWQPLLGLSKVDIIVELLEKGVELDRLWNCYSGGEKPCGECHHCHEMHAIYEQLGL